MNAKDLVKELEWQTGNLLLKGGFDSFPLDTETLAALCNVPLIKLSALSKNRKGERAEIEERGAITLFTNGFYEVYYRDNAPDYCAVVHEIMHVVCLHKKDGKLEENEAEIATLLLTCQPVLVRAMGLRNPWEISDTFKVPLNKLNTYSDIYKLAGKKFDKTGLAIVKQFSKFSQPRIAKKFRRITCKGILLVAAALLLICVGRVSVKKAPQIVAPPTTETTSFFNNTTSFHKTEQPSYLHNIDERFENTEWVYIYPTGNRWHSIPDCSGPDSVPCALWQAEGLKRTPCGKCVK